MSRRLLLVLGFLLGAGIGWLPLSAQVNNPGLTFARLASPPANTPLGSVTNLYSRAFIGNASLDPFGGAIDFSTSITGIGATMGNTAFRNGLLTNVTLDPSATFGSSVASIYANVGVPDTNTQTLSSANITGVFTAAIHAGTGRLGGLYGFSADVESSGMGQATQVWGFDAELYGPSIDTAYAFYSRDQAGIATNAYYSWFDSRGVRRVREDATFDSVGQAIEALYNPQFTKYTPGATDYERGVDYWSGNVYTLTTQSGGTGTLRAMNLGATGVQVQVNGKNLTLSGNLVTTGAFNPTFAIPSSSTWTFPSGGGTLSTTTGTVTSVGLSLPSFITVSNSPVTTTGTLTGTLATQVTKTFLAGPATGADAAPTFRVLATADLPSGTGTVTSIATTSPITGGTITSTGTIACATCGVTGSPLSQFAATTSAQLAGVLSDETGSGVAMFATAPVITTNFTFANGQGFYDDGANIIGLRKTTGSNPQILNLYNTFTDASNYERLALKWASNIVTLGMEKAGTGTARAFNLVDSAGVVALELRVSGQPLVLSGAANTAVSNGLAAVTIHNGTAFRNTTGTAESVLINPNVNPSTTSTYVYQGVYVNPTINYSAVTPGAGSYEALKLAVVETALPTGTNYLIRASAGSAGTTDKFTVTNGGNVANAGTLISTGAVTHSSTTLLSGDVTFSDAINLITNATTGTKFGTATSQKLAFWNATPIVQPVNTTAIDTLLTNTGLRASGGTANFATLVSGTYLQGTTIYSAAGTALPTCNGAAEGARAAVSDALTPTFLTAYVSGGTTHASVYCNGTAWVTD